MKQNAINWFEIYVNDLAAQTQFYSKILGVDMIPAEMESSNMSLFPNDPEKSVGGALSQMEGCKPGPGGTIVYLNVEGDLEGVLSRIPAAGGKVILPRKDISPHGFIGVFSDIEGNIVGLHSMA